VLAPSRACQPSAFAANRFRSRAGGASGSLQPCFWRPASSWRPARIRRPPRFTRSAHHADRMWKALRSLCAGCRCFPSSPDGPAPPMARRRCWLRWLSQGVRWPAPRKESRPESNQPCAAGWRRNPQHTLPCLARCPAVRSARGPLPLLTTAHLFFSGWRPPLCW